MLDVHMFGNCKPPTQQALKAGEGKNSFCNKNSVSTINSTLDLSLLTEQTAQYRKKRFHRNLEWPIK